MQEEREDRHIPCSSSMFGEIDAGQCRTLAQNSSLATYRVKSYAPLFFLLQSDTGLVRHSLADL